MKTPLIAESDVLTFADYFKLNAAIDDVMSYFGYGFEGRRCDLPRTKRDLPHLDELGLRLDETMPHITLTSEIARREFLIAPLLAEVVRWTGTRLRPEFPLRVSPQLQGNLDYLFQQRQRLLVVEAKRDDLDNGFVQMAVELIALDRWDDGEEPLFYGAVSTGTVWQFGILDRKAKQLTQDLNVYGVPTNLEDVARILVGILARSDPAMSTDHFTRRHFLGAAALATLLADEGRAAAPHMREYDGALPGLPHFKAKAKRVIYLFQSGAPSQLDLFDPKPKLADQRGKELPDSIRKGQRLTGMTATQSSFPVAPSKFKFSQHGKSGAWLSELLPHTGKVADRLCFLKAMHTEAINHDPAVTFFQTGAQLAGRPSIGAWLAYGLGSSSRDLPAFVVMISRGSGNPVDQPLYDRLWGSGFLPSKYQGVKLRSGGDPVLYLSSPKGIDRHTRRRQIDDLSQLNKLRQEETGDPEIATRIGQYEMAFRMQSSVPDLTDLSKEPESTFKLYGDDARKPGTYAANCLLARRLVERGVRFVQLFHRGWDQHLNLPKQITGQCRDVDQASAALVTDLARRGLLDDTLVVWGGEFGRTVYCQGTLTAENYGRDHHPRCFSVWLAGGGIKGGVSHGETDDFSYNVAKDGVHVHDLQATILHCLGIDHKKLTFKFQGRHYRLTDVHGEIVKTILA